MPHFFAHVSAALLNAGSTLGRRRPRAHNQHIAIVLPRRRSVEGTGFAAVARRD
jgi:hypothetical protein